MQSTLGQIRLVSFGKQPTNWQDLSATYFKQVKNFDHKVLSEPSGDQKESMQKATKLLLDQLKSGDKLVVCDQRGLSLTSSKLASKLANFSHARTIVAIGPSYGFTQEVLDQADFIWSLSDLTMTHEFARTLVAEQIYRACAISTNHPYHH